MTPVDTQGRVRDPFPVRVRAAACRQRVQTCGSGAQVAGLRAHVPAAELGSIWLPCSPTGIPGRGVY